MYYIELYVKKVRRTRSMPDWTKPASFGIIPLAEVQPMTLLPNISMQAFLEAVRHCEGDVWFESSEHDLLNLKSQFSQYIFAAASLKEDFTVNGTVTCKKPEDIEKLQAFLQS